MSSKDRRRSASYVGDVWLPHPPHGWLPAIATEGKAADAADVVIPPCALRKRIVPVEIGSVAADGLQPRRRDTAAVVCMVPASATRGRKATHRSPAG